MNLSAPQYISPKVVLGPNNNNKKNQAFFYKIIFKSDSHTEGNSFIILGQGRDTFEINSVFSYSTITEIKVIEESNSKIDYKVANLKSGFLCKAKWLKEI